MALFKRSRSGEQPTDSAVQLSSATLTSAPHRVDKSARLKRSSFMRTLGSGSFSHGISGVDVSMTDANLPHYHHQKTSKLQRSFTSLPSTEAAAPAVRPISSNLLHRRRSHHKVMTTTTVVQCDENGRIVSASANPALGAPKDIGFPTATSAQSPSLAPSPIITLSIGKEGRLFAAHQDTLCQSPFFEAFRRENNLAPTSPRLILDDEEPAIFSAILEFLYKGDYYPRLIHNRTRRSWELEDSAASPASTPDPAATPTLSSVLPSHHNYSPHLDQQNFPSPVLSSTSSPRAVEPTVYLVSEGAHILRDTVIYCAAHRYGLESLKRIALRKQGLQSGIDVATILRSAQYAYRHTPDSDSRLRAHYLALIIRCRRTFKRSGTMQAEMEQAAGGSKLFFDLFVAMCNHLDDVIESKGSRAL